MDNLIESSKVIASQVDLFQLQVMLIFKQIETMQREITSQQSKKLPTATLVQSQQQKKPEDEVQNMISSTVELPRIGGLKDIAGLWKIKKQLKSLVILPLNQPQLFINHKVVNSILLFGPPGTGKTHLVHALASEAKAVLYGVSISNMLSPFVGQSEKNVQALFEHVRHSEHSSILFIDEVDGFCRTRNNAEQDHSRRLKTELMCQMSKLEGASNVFLICATNCPWDLDTAFLRRFQKRLYVPLPNIAERRELFQLFTRNTPLEVYRNHWSELIEKTDGFSGSDVSDLVQGALNLPITELEDTKIWKPSEDGFYEPIVTAEDFNRDDIVCCDLSDLPFGSVRTRPVQMLDLFNSLDDITPTVSVTDIKKYETFVSK
ncbi:hypothetical protein NQ315_007232 [Exocentrus adspersus]|uniref:AAA+ ATPase domain-containing protein n=1 Tax=Exocentrus adspersus TaxID=1586481 RepID=A0AAV8WDA1_9CUCU|nr:hypothetical protein NQ315_007232 [Exocentrus adspersus]